MAFLIEPRDHEGDRAAEGGNGFRAGEVRTVSGFVASAGRSGPFNPTPRMVVLGSGAYELCRDIQHSATSWSPDKMKSRYLGSVVPCD